MIFIHKFTKSVRSKQQFRNKGEDDVSVQYNSTNMKRTNITSSKRGSNLISNSQARDYPTTQCHPHHLSHPQCCTPWNRHDPRFSKPKKQSPFYNQNHL
uniref:Putative ovule protein n=1 Tax=Solanum chacoense TaxID=4108 RepID=A0A0V0GUF7_SOLCH